MFPQPTTIQLLELSVNQLTLDLLQEQRLNHELGEIIENQNDELEALRNKIAALEAIIQESENGHDY